VKRSANEAKVAKVSSASAETDFIHVYTHAHTRMRNLFMFSYLNYICTAVTLAKAKYTNKNLLALLQATWCSCRQTNVIRILKSEDA